MNNYYGDIIERIPEPPKWFDEYAVPRYCEFSYEHRASVYADETLLMEIACQDCGRRFMVCMSSTSFYGIAISDLVEAGAIHYGDPPSVGCCLAGPTMNSIPIRVVEFWRLDKLSFDWSRVPELERTIKCEWAGAT